MTWIKSPKPGPADPALLEAVRSVRAGMPAEYGAPASDRVPTSVQRDSIVMSHALLPDVLKGFFGAFNGLVAPELPLSRREHELIAVVVSDANDCFY